MGKHLDFIYERLEKETFKSTDKDTITIFSNEIPVLKKYLRGNLETFYDAENDGMDKSKSIEFIRNVLKKIDYSEPDNNGNIKLEVYFGEMELIMSTVEIWVNILDEELDEENNHDIEYKTLMDFFDRYVDLLARWQTKVMPILEEYNPKEHELPVPILFFLAQAYNDSEENININQHVHEWADENIKIQVAELHNLLINYITTHHQNNTIFYNPNELLQVHDIDREPVLFAFVYFSENDDVFFQSLYSKFIEEIPHLKKIKDYILDYFRNFIKDYPDFYKINIV